MPGEADQRGQLTDDATPRRRRGALPRLLWIGLAGVVLCGVAGFSLLLGFEAGERRFFPYGLLKRVDNKLERVFHLKARAPRLGPRTYPTIYINLVSDVGVVETGRNPFGDPDADRFSLGDFHKTQVGGGLTSFGKDVLLLPFDGVIYAASSSKDIRATGIVAPDNHRADYAADALKPENAGYDFRAGQLRYNDLLFVDTPERRALVASYTEYHSDRGCYTNTLARLDIGASVTSVDEVRAGPEDWTVFFRTEPCLPLNTQLKAIHGTQGGGSIEFAPPSTLYLASGDYHIDGMHVDGPPIARTRRLSTARCSPSTSRPAPPGSCRWATAIPPASSGCRTAGSSSPSTARAAATS